MHRARPGWLRLLLPLAALAQMAGICLGQRATAPWAGLAGLLLAAAAAFLLRGGGRMAALLLTALCVGQVTGYYAWHPTLPEEGTVQVTGVVAEAIRPGNRTQFRTVLRDVTIDDQPLHSGAYWSFYTDTLPEGLEPGVSVRLTARLYHPSGAQNPGGYDFRAWLLQNRVQVGLYGLDDLSLGGGGFSLYGFAAALRERLSRRLIDVMGEEAGSYASALLLGTRYLLPEEDTAAFNRLGIGHILSVSGFHVAVLASILGFLMRKLRLPRKARLPVLAAVLAFYALMTGLNPPIVRAVLLAVLMEYGALRLRQRSSLHLLALAAMLTLLWNPTLLSGASFQMTYCAMLGLCLIDPWLRRRMSTNRLPTALTDRFSSALSVQLAILLPQLYFYHQVALGALVLNVLVLAVSGWLLTACWIALGLMYLPLVGEGVGGMMGMGLRLMTDAVRTLDSLPFSVLWTAQANALTALGWMGLMAALCTLHRLSTRRRLMAAGVALVVMGLSVVPLPHHGTDYIQLAVGNADAAVLHDEATVVVIDTGEDGQALATYLHQRRLSIDTLIISHLHTDHAGGIQALLDRQIPVRLCLLPVGAAEAAIDPGMMELVEALAARGTVVQSIAAGETLSLPGGEAVALWPEEGHVRAGQDANIFSLTLRFDLHGCSLLTTGDLDGAYERYAAATADILKVAHHGSKASTGTAFLEAVSPQVLLVSSGDAERLASVRERAGGLPVYGTQESGAIMLHFEDGQYTIQTFLPN